MITPSLAFRNLGRRKLRTAAGLIVTGCSVLAIQLIGGLYENMFNSIEQDLVATEGHIWVELSDPQPNLTAEMDSAAADSGLFSDSVFRRDVSGLLGTRDSSAVFTGVVLDVEREAEFRSTEQPTYRLQTGPQLAMNLKADTGDFVSGFALDQGFGFEVQRVEATHSADLDRFYQELPADAFWADVGYSHAHFQLAPGASLAEARDMLTGFLASHNLEYELFTYRDSQSYLTSVKQIYRNNYQFITAVIVIAVFFTMANTALMSLLERRREIGTIRSFGAPESHIHIVIFWESLFTAVIAFAAGTVGAFVLGSTINAAGGVYMPPPPTVQGSFSLLYSTSINSIGLSAVLVVATSCLSGQAAILGSHKESIVSQVVV